jgi:hypothetical protein
MSLQGALENLPWVSLEKIGGNSILSDAIEQRWWTLGGARV